MVLRTINRLLIPCLDLSVSSHEEHRHCMELSFFSQTGKVHAHPFIGPLVTHRSVGSSQWYPVSPSTSPLQYALRDKLPSIEAPKD